MDRLRVWNKICLQRIRVQSNTLESIQWPSVTVWAARPREHATLSDKKLMLKLKSSNWSDDWVDLMYHCNIFNELSKADGRNDADQQLPSQADRRRRNFQQCWMFIFPRHHRAWAWQNHHPDSGKPLLHLELLIIRKQVSTSGFDSDFWFFDSTWHNNSTFWIVNSKSGL